MQAGIGKIGQTHLWPKNWVDLRTVELFFREDPCRTEQVDISSFRKHLTLDGDLYKVGNEWLRKKMPDFYCYYFLKFAYANSYSRMHELFLGEIENMCREKDSYNIIKKTI